MELSEEMLALVQSLEVILRIGAAVAMTLAALFMAYGLAARFLRPRPIWYYVGAVATVLAIWRWFIVLLLVNHDLQAYYQVWITPTSAALNVLTGIALFAVAYTCSRRRRGDG